MLTKKVNQYDLKKNIFINVFLIIFIKNEKD